MESKANLLHLPLVPIDWSRGPIALSVLTTEVVSVHPSSSRCPGIPLMKFGEIRGDFYGWGNVMEVKTHEFGSLSATLDEQNSLEKPKNKDPYSFFKVVEAIYRGDEVHFYAPSSDGEEEKEEYYAIPWEQFSDVPGELIDAMLFLDPERSSIYTITPRIAAKAFNALSKVGDNISAGDNNLEPLVLFFRDYGFPRDGKRGHTPRSKTGTPLSPGIVYTHARSQALLAATCKKLWSCINQKDDASIGVMANFLERKHELFLSFIQDVNPIPVSRVPQDDKDNMWRTYARHWLYSVVEDQIEQLFVAKVPKNKNSFAIGVCPGGLKSAMWLSFAEMIYNADNPHEGMRQCKQGGKFRGCGEWYYPDGPYDRSHYCPTCQAKAGAERVARFRAK